MKLYVILSNHGFGHAARTSWIVRSWKLKYPDTKIIINSTLDSVFFRRMIPGEISFRRNPLDIGLIQADSVCIDRERSLQALTEWSLRREELIRSEVEFIQKNKITFVLGDIPPLGGVVARKAGVPSFAIGNFGWDFIYRDQGNEFIRFAEQSSVDNSEYDLLFKLPFSESMDSFSNQQSVGMTGGVPSPLPDSVQEKYFRSGRRRILVAFGGMGVRHVPYEKALRFKDDPGIDFLVFGNAPRYENVIPIDEPELLPLDFLPFVEFVLTKPGYGMLSDLYCSGKGGFFLERSGFAETPLLYNGIRDYYSHSFITLSDLMETDWGFLHRDLDSPEKGATVPVNGNEVIVQTIYDRIS